MSFLKGKGLFGMRLDRSAFLNFALILFTLSAAAALGACGDLDDGDPAANDAKGAANASSASGPIDPKSLTNVNSETFLALDEIAGQLPRANVPIAVDRSRTPTINVRGWAVDQRAKSEAAGVIVNVDGKTDVLANYGQPRPDVAASLKSPGYTNSGFIASIDVSGWEKGRHTLTMRVVTADRKGYFEQKQKYDLDVQ